MAEEQGRRSLARIDHATLLAAIGIQKSAASSAGSHGRGPLGIVDAHRSRAPQRDACKQILAQVYRVVAAVLGPRSADVADVAQDAFMRVHAAIPRFVYDEAKPAGPTAWINTIALRVALDHRAGLPPWERVESDSLDSAPPGDVDRIARTLDESILAAALLDRLDERHRAILILFYWNGDTQEEIAETLGVPLGTVKTRMRAAHQRIREYVLSHADSGEQGGHGDDEEVLGA